jgi:beta-lactamase regulating signal transducer with metallopeptidase domain
MIPLHLLNIAWQSLLLSALAWLIVCFCLRDARRRAWASALGLAVVVIAPLAILALPEQPTEPHLDSSPEVASAWKPSWTVKLQPISAASVEPQPLAVPTGWSWRDLVLPAECVWMFGVLISALGIAWRWVHSWRWQRRLQPSSRHRVRTFEGKGSPCVVGIFSPIIAVSKEQTFSDQQWAWLLAHEGEHIRGGDVAWAWSFEWVRAWLWWNPFVHALIGQWTLAREVVCDAAALRSGEERDGYADFLLEVASSSQCCPALSMAASRPARRLKARLEAMINGCRVSERVGTWFTLGAVALTTLAVSLVSSSGVQAEDETAKRAVAQSFKGTNGNALVTKAYSVPPDFFSYDANPPADPFAAPKPGLQPKLRSDAKAVLKQQGIEFPDGCNAIFNQAASQLIVMHRAAQHPLIEQVIKAMSARLPQIHVGMKLVEGPAFMGKADEQLTDIDFQVMMRGLSQEKGLDILSAPSIITRPRQKALVEVVREVLPPQGSSGDLKLLGVSCELDPQVQGDGTLLLKGVLTLGGAANQSPSWNTNDATKVRYEDVTMTSRKFEAALQTGATLVQHFGETKPGRFVTCFITATALRPDGKPANRFDENTAGKVKSRVVPDAATKTSAEEAKRVETKQVFVNAKWVEAPTNAAPIDLPKLLKDFALFLNTEVTPDKPPGQVEAKPLSPVQLSGVLTDPQFQVIIREVSKRKDMRLLIAPEVAVTPGNVVKLIAKDRECMVIPSLGADGYTIDLLIRSQEGGEVRRKLATSVSVWDGQTVVLGDGKGRLIFITANIIDPSGTPAKKP